MIALIDRNGYFASLKIYSCSLCVFGEREVGVRVLSRGGSWRWYF
jgi:hypothetical protein